MVEKENFANTRNEWNTKGEKNYPVHLHPPWVLTIFKRRGYTNSHLQAMRTELIYDFFLHSFHPFGNRPRRGSSLTKISNIAGPVGRRRNYKRAGKA